MGQVFIELSPAEQREFSSEEILQDLRAKTGDIPGVDTLHFTAIHGGPGGAAIHLEVNGERLGDLIAVAGEIKKPKSGLTNLQRMKRIEELLDEIRPNLQRDHGDVELIEVDGKYIYVKMTGACAGCQMASTTLGGIQQHLAEGLGEFIQVLPAEELARRAAMGA